MTKQQTFIERCYNDKEGKLALFQAPNLPLYTWAGSFVFSKVFAYGRSHDVFYLLGYGAIFTWAWLELFQGSCYLRRLLGFIVLFYTVYSKVR